MLTANDLVNTCLLPLRQGAGYIWGMSGVTWTKALQERYAPQRDTTRLYGAQWIGKRVWDCSGLIMWACKLYGVQIFHGSDTIWHKYCSNKGGLTMDGSRSDGLPLKPGSAVFLYDSAKNSRHHIGTYVGDGKCVEAKGTRYGVVMSDISRWDEWGELACVDYSGQVVIDTESLRIGMKSDAVKVLQTHLNAMGYDCGNADGIFGPATRAAVIKLQAVNGLTADGVVGPKTQEVIDEYFGKTEQLKTDDPQQQQIIMRLASALKAAQNAADILSEIIQELKGLST